MATILVVDEAGETRDALVDELESHRVTVLSFDVMDDAAEVIRSEGDNIDVVITEMMLPFRGANSNPNFIPGSLVLDALRGTDIPVILIPSWNTPDLAGVNVVARLPKPFRYKEVATKALEIISRPQPA